MNEIRSYYDFESSCEFINLPCCNDKVIKGYILRGEHKETFYYYDNLNDVTLSSTSGV